MRELVPGRARAGGDRLAGRHRELRAGVGILCGGWLADHVGWRSTFWIGAGHARAVDRLRALLLPPLARARARSGQLDVLGGVLFAPAVAAILLAVTRLKGSGLGDPRDARRWRRPASSCCVVWVRREMHHPDPMLDVRQFRQRQIGLAMLLMLLFGLGTAQLMLVVLLLAQQPVWTGIGLGLTATRGGDDQAARASWRACSARPGAATWRRGTARGAPRWSAPSSSACQLGRDARCGMHAVWQLVVLTFVAAVGGAVLYAAIPNLMVEVVPAERTSELNGMSHVLRTVGTAIGTQA